MKIQKILNDLESNSKAFLIRQLIISRLDDLKDIREAITKHEKDLTKEVEDILKNDSSLKELYPFFKLIVSNHKDETDYQDTLLNAICLQIAQSLSNLYDQPEKKANAFVNYGGKHFTISASEIFKILPGSEPADLHGLFDKFNKTMEKYEIRIKQLNYTVSDVSPHSIHIRILK